VPEPGELRDDAVGLVDLGAIGDQVDGPDLEAQERARARLGPADHLDDDPDDPDDLDGDSDGAGPRPGLGRLLDLALWWAAVRGDDRAGPPASVVQLGAERAVPVGRAAGMPRLLDLAPPPTAADALRWGVDLADRLADEAVELVLVGCPDPLPATVLTAELMGLDAVEACGWPLARGMSDAAWMDEVDVVREGLRRTRGLRGTTPQLLVALGSPATAACTAFLLRSAARRTPVILDGRGAAAAAMTARRSARPAGQWWQAATGSSHPLGARMLDSLELEPLTDLGIEGSDGLAGVTALAVLDVAASVLSSDGGPTAPGHGGGRR